MGVKLGPINGTSNSYDVITATNQAGALDYWWAADGSGLAWNPETIAANGTKAVYATPGIAVTSTSVAVTAINTKPGNVMYWYQPFGTTPGTSSSSPRDDTPGAIMPCPRRPAAPAGGGPGG
jgi:hypothetical protein